MQLNGCVCTAFQNSKRKMCAYGRKKAEFFYGGEIQDYDIVTNGYRYSVDLSLLFSQNAGKRRKSAEFGKKYRKGIDICGTGMYIY